jgi:hypothetical protein
VIFDRLAKSRQYGKDAHDRAYWKAFLQIPGPTNVPDRVLRAMDMPTMDHRGPEFAEIGHAVLAAMQRVFRTKQPVIIYRRPAPAPGRRPSSTRCSPATRC